MIFIAPEILCFIVPFALSVPAYILGRKLWFKGVPQSQMHIAKGGRLFTLAVAGLHLALMLALFFGFVF